MKLNEQEDDEDAESKLFENSVAHLRESVLVSVWCPQQRRRPTTRLV